MSVDWKRIHAVLFDLDGTLVDSSDIICASFNTALRRLGLSEIGEDVIRAMIGRPLQEMFSEQNPAVPVALLVEEYKKAFSQLTPNGSRLLPGAPEILALLSETKKMAVVTSRSRVGAGRLLDHFNLLSYFSVIVGFEDVQRFKPDPEPVLLALERLAAGAAQTLLVGDTTHDMGAAKEAGTYAVGVTTGPHDAQTLTRSGADLTVDSLHQLRDIVPIFGPEEPIPARGNRSAFKGRAGP